MRPTSGAIPNRNYSPEAREVTLTKEELLDYFNEHVLYELLMLRYAKGRLRSQTQILWNSMFATFNISARNLYEFLNNKGGNNEINVHDYRAFYGNFERSSISDITGTLQLLNEQCFHMGKKRPKAVDKKVNLDRIQTVFDWVEGNVTSLLNNFETSFRAQIQIERADPSRVTHAEVSGPTGASPSPSATNHPTFLSNKKQ